MADMAHLSDFSEWEDFPLFAPPGTEIPRLEEDSSEGVSNAIGALSHLLYDEETPQEASELLRDEGNRHFKCGKKGYKNAIKKYSDAIIAAKDVPEALAPAFLNRATAEFKLGNYGKCLRDVDMSLRYEPGIVKVHYRAVLCALKLEKLQIAQHHCEQALSLLEQNMDPKSVKDNKYWFEVQKGNITSLIEVQRKRDMEREKKRLEKRAIESSLASKLEIRGVKFGAPLFGQQRRYKITQPVEKEGTLHWPLLLVYSSGNSKSSVGTVQGDQSDYLEDVPENASMDDILTSVFSENMPPPAWDVNRQYYSADNLEMRFRKNWTIKKSEEDCEEDEDGSMLSPDELGTWVKLKGDRTLADVVAMRDYVTPLFPVLYVVPKRMRLS